MYVRDEHSRPRNEVHLIFRSNFGHSNYSTEVKFTSFFFGGFITAIAVNPLERKLAKRTSVQSSCSHLVAKHMFVRSQVHNDAIVCRMGHRKKSVCNVHSYGLFGL